mgnify:CR=1 FL=1
MRTPVIIATILAISIAVPAGLLLTGTLSTTQSIEPTKELNAPGSIVQAPREPVREQLPAAPEPKSNIVAEPPKENASKPPEQAAILPPKLPEAQPPQQPAQQPQVAVPKQDIREGLPANFILKGSLVTIRVALGNEGVNAIRVNLTDFMLIPYPAIKEALINLNSTTRTYVKTCQHPACVSPPTADFKFTEQALGEFIQLVNPPPPRQPFRLGDEIERKYDSVITYNGVRYSIFIFALWGPP